MIAAKNTAEVTSTFEGETVAMGLDPLATNHLMGILANMYPEPEDAIIREYSNNGWDAHVEAGTTHLPIEISLPTRLAPFLTIRDYGTGMDRETIVNTYSKYGASTKRDTNDQQGMLGIGSKSALAYAAQFTVTSVKNGKRMQVAVSRTNSGGGNMEIVERDIPTTDPNGTTVVIPCEAQNTIAERVRKFFRFWEPGRVLVNGEPVEPFKGLPITDTITLIEEGKSYVVMGGVAYPTTKIDHGMTAHLRGVVARVPIGSVAFTPDRSALMTSPETNATLAKITETFKSESKKAVQKEINKAATPVEAIAAMVHWNSILPASARQRSYTYRGRTMPVEFTEAPEPVLDYITGKPKLDEKGKPITEPVFFRMADRTSHKLSQNHKEDALPANLWASTLIVHGFDREQISPATAKKARKLLDDNYDTYNNVRHIAYTQAKPDPYWIPAENLVDWETVKAIKLPRNTASGRTGVATAGTYDQYVNDDHYYKRSAEDIDLSYPVYWITDHPNHGVRELLGKRDDGENTIVIAPQHRLAKFQRLFPEAISAYQAAREYASELVKTIDPTDLALMAMIDDAYGISALRGLDPARVDDPEIKFGIELAQMDLTKPRGIRNLCNMVGVKATVEEESNWASPLNNQNYPLWDSYDFNRHPDHMYLYLNAAYAARDTTTEDHA